jgi:hypothetical protein
MGSSDPMKLWMVKPSDSSRAESLTRTVPAKLRRRDEIIDHLFGPSGRDPRLAAVLTAKSLRFAHIAAREVQ